MYIDKYLAGSKNIDLFQKYRLILLTLVTLIASLSVSHSAFALFVPNPGATCPAGFSKDQLKDSDYTSLLLTSATSTSYFDVTGNSAGSIPLQMRMDLDESNANNTSNNFSIIGASEYKLINIGRNFPTQNDYTDIKLSFRNKTTQQPMYLTNVAISAFDVDYSAFNNNLFDDYVRITGTTQSGAIIDGTLQTITGSNVIYDKGLNNSTTFNCPSRDLDTRCQGSVKFSEAVSTVTVRYSNNTAFIRANPTNQEIQFRVDNYCYAPQYIFSGTVFDDNGGITAAQASATNADITTASSAYTNRPNYFNGKYDPTAPETGIAGSTVRLANCSNTSTTYPTQSVNRTTSPLSVGEYQISIPKTTLANNTDLCLVESRTGTTYPIRTSSESRSVGFSATTYNYPNNDFGRVIAENAALVLRKAQYVNNCPPTINYTDAAINTASNLDPTKGFSESSINGSIIPGQCIAYRITATNRSNLSINDFIMQDKLQEKGKENAVVSSFLTLPISTTNGSDYASNSVKIGENGIVLTKPLVLPARSKRDFYFNTKYGTTVNTQ
tara:strand:- start:16 stop:1677 length:1662 start_codon:yes stop_codon:yes gene_type:complete